MRYFTELLVTSNLLHVVPDEGAIIGVIANRSNAQRQQIKEKFKDIQIKVK